MKKILLILIFSFSLMLCADVINDNSSDRESSVNNFLRIGFEFNSCPYMYDFGSGGDFTAFSGSLSFTTELSGVKYFYIGGAIQIDYLTSDFNSLNMSGAEFGIKSLFVVYYSPVRWVELRFGAGVLWSSGTYSDNLYRVNQQKVGIPVIVNAAFIMPFKYIHFEVKNSLDISFNINKGTVEFNSDFPVQPEYYGALNITFHPYFSWINIFVETGINLFVYSDSYKQYLKPQFVWTIGTAIDIKVPDIANTFISLTVEQPVVSEGIGSEEDNRFTALENAGNGASISFSDILFYPDSDRILEASFSILDRIASIIKSRPEVSLEIGGHTNSTGNEEEELNLSFSRALSVLRYLSMKGGLEMSRMFAQGFGGTKPIVQGINDSNRRVEFKIRINQR